VNLQALLRPFGSTGEAWTRPCSPSTMAGVVPGGKCGPCTARQMDASPFCSDLVISPWRWRGLRSHSRSQAVRSLAFTSNTETACRHSKGTESFEACILPRWRAPQSNSCISSSSVRHGTYSAVQSSDLIETSGEAILLGRHAHSAGAKASSTDLRSAPVSEQN
jgi:hypothetical protein